MSKNPPDASWRAPPDAYDETWRAIRRSRAIQITALVGTMVCGAALGATKDHSAGLLFGILGLAAILVIVLLMARSGCRCPRCGAAFFQTRGIYVVRCPACGIEVGTPKAGAVDR